ncbi:MAG: hypothetical protein JNK72_10470 [Myxococcales bacterium]|nr:hypothetical protein [Myxococcales bacterium]
MLCPRRLALAPVALTLALGACGSRARTPEPSEAPLPPHEGALGLSQGPQRCELAPVSEATPLAALTAILQRQSVVTPGLSLLRGPDGPRAVALTQSEAHWQDARGHGQLRGLTVPPVPEQVSIGFAGERVLGAIDNLAFEAPPREGPVRGASFTSGHRALSVSAVGTRPGAALYVYSVNILGRRDEIERAELHIQRLDARGGVLGEPSVWPIAGDGVERLGEVRVRWDFGHYVATLLEYPRGERRSWVLSPEGEPLLRESGLVACPASGCVKVEVHTEGGEGASMLRLSSPSGNQYWNTGVAAQDALGVAVSGTRLLVMHSPAPGLAGCSVAVLDPGHNTTLFEQTLDALRCDPDRVVATPRGFAMLEVDEASALRVRQIACSLP